MHVALRKGLTDQSGSAAIITGIVILVLLGCAAVALDIAHMVTVESQLQKAADAGAMAGARGLWPETLPVIINPPPNPNCSLGLVRAMETLTQNRVDGAYLTSDQVTVQVGRWDYGAKTFSPGCTANSNSVRVTTRRSGMVMLFAKIFGINTADLTGSATAVMDFVKGVGKGCLPIAINEPFVIPGNELTINFNPDPLDNGGWFTDPPDRANAATFRDYIVNDSCPPLYVGDPINLQNGQDGSVLQCLKDELVLHPGGWDTFLPMVNTPKFNQAEPIMAFVPFRITEVTDNGSDKHVKGTIIGMAITSGSAMPGGGNKGALAPPKLVN